MRGARGAGGLLTLALLALPATASAHGAVKGIGAFYGGLQHPLLNPAQLIALLLLGLAFGQRGVAASLRALAALALALALGLLASANLPALPTDTPLLVLAALLGLLVAAAWRAPEAVFVAFAALLGLGIGLGSVIDAAPGGGATVMRLGNWIGATLCAACVGGFADSAKSGWPAIVLRVIASWLTAGALLALALAISR
ncbi:HupE/UreJ family protein [Variovorax sp. YR752]|uniref:HupE/UreJ family protein n=1 Tax=Variovorax sp. YR752 TaxID=1884383 RepID=UPI0031379112